MSIYKCRNYIIAKNYKEVTEAMKCELCRYIIMEVDNFINIWTLLKYKWYKERYILTGTHKEKDLSVSGHEAYQAFYSYCGKSEIDRMKSVYNPIPKWESCEQMHYCNIEYINEKIYKNIYEFDANSAFTYGIMQLPHEFDKLKEYAGMLYDKKKEAKSYVARSKYKNMQNFLVGYFNRVKELVAVRSKIIENSNNHIKSRMAEIRANDGITYISNTDSIITDDKGYEVMTKYIGNNVGDFKLEKSADRLFYKSSNAYQLGNVIKHSGVKYFARKNTDFFRERYAVQHGHLIEGFDYDIECDGENSKICRVRYGQITVDIYNRIGEHLEQKIYSFDGGNYA